MLEELRVRDIALLREGDLEFGPGLTVLTGETGTGKTALLSALKLLVGERADSSMVRDGAAEAIVEGRFLSKGEELLVKRRVGSDGRSKCYLDDSMSTVAALAQRVGPLVDLYGQHEHQSLLDTASHVRHLDRWIGEEASRALAAYQEARSASLEADRRVEQVRSELAQAALDIDAHTFALMQIDEVGPREGEYEELDARLPILQNAERLAECAQAALSGIRDEGGAADCVARSRAELLRVTSLDPEMERYAERLKEAAVLLDDVGSDLRTYRDSVDHDGTELQRTLDRLGAIDGLMRRFGPRIEDVFERRERAARALELQQDGDGALQRATEEAATALAELVGRAEALSALRRANSQPFLNELGAAIDDLGMHGASFTVSVTDLPQSAWGPSGPHRVEFLFSPGPGASPRPLAKIASGGELSRVMLALKGVLLGDDEVETLVFDEIDAGIGGATALAVGRRLALLARTYQVVVVTHLAQVAAFADAHLLVEKDVGESETVTRVRPVRDDERVLELARMLAGTTDSEALAHARALLGEVAPGRAQLAAW